MKYLFSFLLLCLVQFVYPPQTDRETAIKRHIDGIIMTFEEYQKRIERTIGITYDQVQDKLAIMRRTGVRPVLQKEKFSLFD